MVRFMGHPSHLQLKEEIRIFSRVKPWRASNEWGRSKGSRAMTGEMMRTLPSTLGKINLKMF